MKLSRPVITRSAADVEQQLRRFESCKSETIVCYIHDVYAGTRHAAAGGIVCARTAGAGALSRPRQNGCSSVAPTSAHLGI